MEEHFTKTVIPFERLDETFRSKDIHVLLFSLKLPASHASWSKYYLQNYSSRFNLIWYTGNTDHVYLKIVSVLMRKFYGTWAAWQNKSSIEKWMDSIRLFAFYKEITRNHFVTLLSFWRLFNYIPYGGKFSRGPNFHTIFVTHDQNTKIRTAKIWTRELLEIFTPCVLCTGLVWSDVSHWHYSAISNRLTTSYPFPRDIFHPLLAWRR